MRDTVGPDPIRSPALDSFAESGIRHGFFTRAGGVSQGVYRGLNVGQGSDDRPQDVAENRDRVARWMGVGAPHLVTVHQVIRPTRWRSTRPSEPSGPAPTPW